MYFLSLLVIICICTASHGAKCHHYGTINEGVYQSEVWRDTHSTYRIETYTDPALLFLLMPVSADKSYTMQLVFGGRTYISVYTIRKIIMNGRYTINKGNINICVQGIVTIISHNTCH